MTSTYTELNIRKVERLTNTQADGLDPTYSQLILRRNEVLIAKEEDPPLASGPGAQAAAQERESTVKIGNRPYRLICIICLVTSAVILTVAGVLIHELAFSHDWIRNEDGCYFISTCNNTYDDAKKYCSNSDSKLLELNSAEEENFFTKTVSDQGISYWIGKCKDREVASNVMFRMSGGDPECAVCGPYTELKPCDQVRTRFICERSAHLCAVISQKIQDLCQQPVEPT
ncbi:uncharacterized protein [Hemitrygon akajei]|uniref:uncharacterized protein n=1 Tax=Hemitrygon akajei TaxID=2704970 RepID=UPI003BF9758B